MWILKALVLTFIFLCASVAFAQDATPSAPQIPVESTPGILKVLNTIPERATCNVENSKDGTYTQILWCQEGIGTLHGVSGYELYGSCTALSSTLMLLINAFVPAGVNYINVTLGFDGNMVSAQFGGMTDVPFTGPWLLLGQACAPDTVNK